MAPFYSPHPPITVPEESYATFLLKEDKPYPSDFPAYVDGITGQTYARKVYKDEVMVLAYGLRNVERLGLLGLHRGSTAVVFSPNSLLYPVVMLALVCSVDPSNVSANNSTGSRRHLPGIRQCELRGARAGSCIQDKPGFSYTGPPISVSDNPSRSRRLGLSCRWKEESHPHVPQSRCASGCSRSGLEHT